jgi:hypothetical protein
MPHQPGCCSGTQYPRAVSAASNEPHGPNRDVPLPILRLGDRMRPQMPTRPGNVRCAQTVASKRLLMAPCTPGSYIRAGMTPSPGSPETEPPSAQSPDQPSPPSAGPEPWDPHHSPEVWQRIFREAGKALRAQRLVREAYRQRRAKAPPADPESSPGA